MYNTLYVLHSILLEGCVRIRYEIDLNIILLYNKI